MSTPDALAAAQRDLQAAVQDLIQPITETISRSPAAEDPGVRETDTDADRDHAERTAILRKRHAAALRCKDHAGGRRALAALIKLELAFRESAAARRRTQTQLPSLLDQLLDAVQSRQGHGGGAAGPHRSPIGLAAAELLGQIRRTVSARPEHDLSVRLRSWASLAGHWRTTEPERLLSAARDAQRWVASARTVLDPPRPLDLVAACPECGTRIVYVRDDSGELVRRPALQVDRVTGTARCLAVRCSAVWPPARLRLLARVLEQQQKAEQQLKVG